MNAAHYDMVILGSGPGGEGAAMQAAKSGKSVAVVESSRNIGGFCTHRGTIPSKALRFAIFQMTEANHNPLFHEAGVSLNISFQNLRRSARSVIDRQVDMRRTFYDRNHVPIICGRGPLHRRPHHRSRRTERRQDAAHGRYDSSSPPARGPTIRPTSISNIRACSTATRFSISTTTPQSITVYGAGVIGCEYTSMFRNLGVKVNLINTRDKLLEFLDDEIIDALSYHLRDQGVLLRHNEAYERIEPRDDGVVLHLKSGKQLKTDILLWANGRTGNSDNMGLEAIGIQPDHRGLLAVNEYYQTAVPHIYAVGDVIGFPSLASAAYVQGRFAATHAMTGEADPSLVRQHSDRHLHQPGNQLGRQDRTRS